MKKNKWIKIMALLALFWIIITVIWTGLLIIFDNNNSSNIKQELTPEQLMQFQEMMNSWTLLNEWTWELVWSWNLENK
jgi:hypothetical protein